MKDFAAKKLGAAAFIALLATMIFLHAENASDAACIAATGIGGAIFILGFFGVFSIMSLGLILAYPFMKPARKNLHDLGALPVATFGLGPVICGAVLYFTGGC